MSLKSGIHVVIDARLAGQRGGGIGTYSRELCAALLAAPAEFCFTILSVPGALPLVAPALARQRAALTPAHHRWEGVTFGFEAWSLRPALIHTPDFVPPSIRPCPAVVTIHDLAFLHWPEMHDHDGRSHYGQIHQAITNAEGIIAVSETTRRDLYEYVGVDPARVTVVPEAASADFQPVPVEQRPSAVALAGADALIASLVLGQHGPYFLVVGTIEPRKNLPMLLRAYDRLVEQWPDAPRLVLAGRLGWLADETMTMLACMRARDRVYWANGPSTPELVLLYAAALALVFPSRYEGFGLPALEAMACATPVLAADTPALREVVADAGWLLPIDDEGAWAEALKTVSQDEALRARLVAAGRRRVARFSWARAAKQTLSVYRRVLGDA